MVMRERERERPYIISARLFIVVVPHFLLLLRAHLQGLFVYAYSFFYYFSHAGFFGILQTSFYFLYMANAAFAFFLMMGAVGFYSSFGECCCWWLIA